MHRIFFWSTLFCLVGISPAVAEGTDVSAAVEENNPWAPHLGFPKLITPQWLGEPGVEAVVVLAIDDMRDSDKYEAYLRPILQRLKQIDGRAPVSIMSCQVRPDDPQLQTWIDEGLSIEVHTASHPCPLLQGGDFDKSLSTYERCVDMMASIPRNKPVAFRTPCCDSLNTVSPRFYDAIFSRTTAAGNSLQADSSVFNIFTDDDPAIPKELLRREDGTPRFRPYIPKGLKRGDAIFDTFVNTIENYPFPYLIDGLCWQFPCVVPSDWEAQFRHQPDNPQTVRDWQAALDITVLKRGVMCLVFHPHNWIKPTQVNELIDYAVKKHGRKVKFLTFREAMAALNEFMLDGHPARNDQGEGNGVRTLDVDLDGFMDVVIGSPERQATRLWDSQAQQWRDLPFPGMVAFQKTEHSHPTGSCRFGISPATGAVELVVTDGTPQAYQFQKGAWKPDPKLASLLKSFRFTADKIAAPLLDLFFRDVNQDGHSELFVLREATAAEKAPSVSVFAWENAGNKWKPLPVQLPLSLREALSPAHRKSVRFVTLEDRGLDITFSSPRGSGCFLVDWFGSGKVTSLLDAATAEAASLPYLVRADGTDNGFFVHSGHLFWQNEDTSDLPDLVDRRKISALVAKVDDHFQMPEPMSPEASRAAIKTKSHLQVELVASEPLIADPVAIDWGPDGKLWVVEMGAYPNGVAVNPQHQKQVDSGRGEGIPLKPSGRVKFLEDTNEDGRYDKATLFLDELSYPTGIHCFRNGVLISDAPEILFAADTDGDGRADVRKTLSRGFKEGNPQHRVNGFRWGLDNWFYLANGDSGGKIVPVAGVTSEFEHSPEPIDTSGRDLRLNADNGQLEAVSGQTQCGRARDDWGNWFGNSNSRPLFHYVLDDSALRRNPALGVRDTRREVPEIPGAAPVYPRSETLTRFNDFDRANRFTSACSSIIYRDTALGEEFYGNSFTCEPVHNLVSRGVLEREGASFRSHRAQDEQESEFLGSTDNWFRPAMVRTGPEGGLWIVDMYRMVIEHPQWIPDDWKAHLNLRAGEDRGRIYRIVPKQRPQDETRQKSDLAILPDKESSQTPLPAERLIGMLESPNGWQRDTAQRLLVERQDSAIVPQLNRLVETASQPTTRIQALATLDGLHACSQDVLLTALRDAHPGVRRLAVKLSCALPKVTDDLAQAVLTGVDDPDPWVQQELGYSLVLLSENAKPDLHTQIAAAVARLSCLSSEDAVRTAALTSLTAANAFDVFQQAIALRAQEDVSEAVLARLATMTARMIPDTKLRSLCELLATDALQKIQPWHFETAAVVFDRLKPDEPTETAPRTLTSLAAELAFQHEAATPLRTAALHLLAQAGQSAQLSEDKFIKIFTPTEPAEVQNAALNVLAHWNDAATLSQLLTDWRALSPQLRQQLISILVDRAATATLLLDAINAGTIRRQDVSIAQRDRLNEYPDQKVQSRARELFAQAGPSSRTAVLKQFESALSLPADLHAGEQVFTKRCAMCHQVGGVGRQIGADLTALTDKSPRTLLTAILDPNKAVEAKYLSYVAVTEDGRIFSGMLIGETSNSIMLISADGKEQTLLRQDLEQLRCSEKSFMPEGLEADLNEQQIADVMAFVAARSGPPKSFPENRPAVLSPGAEGRLVLSARNGAIYGPTLIYEPQYRNAGYWQDPDDFIRWDLRLSTAKRYQVTLHYACDNSAAGSVLEIRCGESRIPFTVSGTNGWSNYEAVSIGTIDIPAGRSQVVALPSQFKTSALIDLHSLVLTPVP